MGLFTLLVGRPVFRATGAATMAAVTTIEQIEREVWPDPGPDASVLVRRCTELRRKPVAEFTAEDLRIMLGQQIGVPVLLPLAVRILLRDPLVEGDCYPGDLLSNVLRLPDSAWSDLRPERRRLASVLTRFISDPQFGGPGADRADRQLRDGIEQFLNR